MWCRSPVSCAAHYNLKYAESSLRERRAACKKPAADAWSAHSIYDSWTRTYLTFSLHIFNQNFWITFGDTGLTPCTLVYSACVFVGFCSYFQFYAKLLLSTWIWKSQRFTMDQREVILDTHWTSTTQRRTETCKWEFKNFFVVYVVLIKMTNSQREAPSSIFRNNHFSQKQT